MGKALKLKEMLLTCRHCQKYYDLAKSAHGIRKGKIRCPHCNKIVGSI
jgi:predicted Zn finger-like uncharacterized protein